MSTSIMKISLTLFLVSMAILAPSATARMEAAAPSPLALEDLSFSNCTPFILEATMCVVGVIKFPVAPHPSCCKAISDLDDCSPETYQHIPGMDIIKKICSLSSTFCLDNQKVLQANWTILNKKVMFMWLWVFFFPTVLLQYHL